MNSVKGDRAARGTPRATGIEQGLHLSSNGNGVRCDRAGKTVCECDASEPRHAGRGCKGAVTPTPDSHYPASGQQPAAPPLASRGAGPVASDRSDEKERGDRGPRALGRASRWRRRNEYGTSGSPRDREGDAGAAPADRYSMILGVHKGPRLTGGLPLLASLPKHDPPRRVPRPAGHGRARQVSHPTTRVDTRERADSRRPIPPPTAAGRDFSPNCGHSTRQDVLTALALRLARMRGIGRRDVESALLERGRPDKTVPAVPVARGSSLKEGGREGFPQHSLAAACPQLPITACGLERGALVVGAASRPAGRT